MHSRLNRPLFAALAGLAIFASVGTRAARAEYDIVISAPTLGAIGGSIDINVFDPTLNTSSDPNVIDANIVNLNATLAAANAGFRFSELSADKTQVNATTSQLNITGTIVTTLGGAAVPVTITASSVDYTIPAPGFVGILTSTSSDSFSGGFGGKTFRSFYDPTNTEFATTVPSPILIFPPKPNSASDNGTATETNVGVVPGNFSLTNTSVITLGPLGASDLFTGVTTIRAVPEPGSMALLLVGGVALAMRMRGRKVEA
jgi:hypothetical protein